MSQNIEEPIIANHKDGTDKPSTNGMTVSEETNGHASKLGGLASFLQNQKDRFIDDLKGGNGKGWILAMGNEAGDLDSLASSIAYAQLSNTLSSLNVVPLVQTPSSYMRLRPENLLAFKNAFIPPSVLLHTENIPVPTTELASLGVRFALVDHNRLSPMFGTVDESAIQGVIDHHEDENLYQSAEIRKIAATGSCTSLVTEQFKSAWSEKGLEVIPKELSTLLLSGILIDTDGLKKGGKAISTDYDSASFLYPLTPWSEGTISITSTELTSSVPKSLMDQTKSLIDTKYNVSFLSTQDLLFRDYKEYILPTSSTTSFPILKVGLSTVPLGMKKWLEKEGGGWKTYLDSLDTFMIERNLDIEGVLTTFNSDKGKHKRELLLVIRIGGALDKGSAEKAINQLVEGLESDVVLKLEPWDTKVWKKFLDRKKRQGLDSKTRFGRVWKQGNAKATRKQVAPIVRNLVAKLQ